VQKRNIPKLEGVCVFNLAAYLDKRAEVGIDKAACRWEGQTAQLWEEKEVQGRTCQQITRGQGAQQLVQQLTSW